MSSHFIGFLEELVSHAQASGLSPRHTTYYLSLSGNSYIELVVSMN